MARQHGPTAAKDSHALDGWLREQRSYRIFDWVGMARVRDHLQ